jgi:hypothetical protein
MLNSYTLRGFVARVDPTVLGKTYNKEISIGFHVSGAWVTQIEWIEFWFCCKLQPAFSF